MNEYRKDNRALEYKSDFTRTYLKTVSAFANYTDGEIIFGVNDNLSVTGIENPVQFCLNIENQINDNISPKPDYFLRINSDNTVTLKILNGEATPYLYKGKAYKRNDTSTIEVGELELKRLTLKSLNLNFEDLPSHEQNLTFTYLEKCFKDKINLNELSIDALKTLNLYNDKDGYNNAAAL